MEKKILICGSTLTMAQMSIIETLKNNIDNIKPKLFEIQQQSSSKFAIMGTNEIPSVADRINLDIIDDLEDSNFVTIYHPRSQGITEAKTVPGIDNLNRLTDADINQLNKMISLMPNGGPADLGQLYEELGKISTPFSYVKPKKEAKITPNPSIRQYKSKRK